MDKDLLQNALRLYAITAEGAYLSPRYKARVRLWLQAGVRAVQFREKGVERERLLPLGRFLRAICAEYGALLIVNDDIELAAELRADGCHLGQEDADLKEARRRLGRRAILGLSTHTAEQVIHAKGAGADYIGVGPIFRPVSKPSPWAPLGPEFAGWAARASGLPTVAIGGVSLSNVERVARAGCPAAAVISALHATSRPARTTRAFLDILLSAGSARLGSP
jgi:thiamine-phosphate diphosphorylase